MSRDEVYWSRKTDHRYRVSLEREFNGHVHRNGLVIHRIKFDGNCTSRVRLWERSVLNRRPAIQDPVALVHTDEYLPLEHDENRREIFPHPLFHPIAAKSNNRCEQDSCVHRLAQRYSYPSVIHTDWSLDLDKYKRIQHSLVFDRCPYSTERMLCHARPPFCTRSYSRSRSVAYERTEHDSLHRDSYRQIFSSCIWSDKCVEQRIANHHSWWLSNTSARSVRCVNNRTGWDHVAGN